MNRSSSFRRRTRRLLSASGLVGLCALILGAGSASAIQENLSYPPANHIAVNYSGHVGWCYHTIGYAPSVVLAIKGHEYHAGTDALRMEWCSNGHSITHLGYPKGGIAYLKKAWPVISDELTQAPFDQWWTDQYGDSALEVVDDANFCVNPASLGSISVGGCTQNFQSKGEFVMTASLFQPASGNLPLSAYFDNGGWHFILPFTNFQ